MQRLQSQSSPTPRLDPTTMRQGHIMTQRILDALGAVLPRRLLRQPQRKFLNWKLMITEVSCWMENFILSRRLYQKRFILVSYLGSFGMHSGRKRWGYHSICIIWTRTRGRRKTTVETWRLPQPRLISRRKRQIIQKQCSATLHSLSHLPQLKFNRTLPQLHWPRQRISLLKEYSLLQVLGFKCWQPQLQETQTILPLWYLSPKWLCRPKMGLLSLIKAESHIQWILWWSRIASPLIMESPSLHPMGRLMHLTSYNHPCHHHMLSKKYPHVKSWTQLYL